MPGIFVQLNQYQNNMNGTSRYLKNFFDEKIIPFQIFEVKDTNGLTHMVNTNVIIECILNTGMGQQISIANSLKKIDYYNASVTDYFKFLAKVLVKKFD